MVIEVHQGAGRLHTAAQRRRNNATYLEVIKNHQRYTIDGRSSEYRIKNGNYVDVLKYLTQDCNQMLAIIKFTYAYTSDCFVILWLSFKSSKESITETKYFLFVSYI